MVVVVNMKILGKIARDVFTLENCGITNSVIDITCSIFTIFLNSTFIQTRSYNTFY